MRRFSRTMSTHASRQAASWLPFALAAAAVNAYAAPMTTTAIGVLPQAPSVVLPAAATPLKPARKKMRSALQPVKRTLPNGLTVLVTENHAAPVVAVRMYVRTGSIYEGQYLGAGISHLFEHNLSEGTSMRTKVQINEDTQGIGGQSNAYTSYDVTAYHIATASSYFERALNGLADEMQNATFPEAEVKTQQGVIHSEMSLDEDDPDRVLNDVFYQTAFLVHPVRFPIIGYRQSFDRLTQADIVNYYKSHYTPENTIVSIAGDVDANRALDMVGEAFKNWQRRAASTPALPDEPMQTTPRRAAVEKDVNLTYMQLGWHTIPLQHPDLYALDTLAQILGGGDSSRLVRSLREKQNIVSSIGAYSSTPNYNAGVFGVRATMPPAMEKRVEGAIWQQIGRIWRDGVSREELQRAQRQIETNFVFNSSSVEEQAEQVAYDYLGTGDPTYSRRYVERIQAVTPEQVRAAALKYITREGTTTAVVRPRGATPRNAASSAKQAATKPPQLVTLSNGMRLIVRENHAAPTVSIVAYGAGGARLEPANKAGVSSIFAQMLTRGTPKRNAEQIAATVDDLGASLDGFSGYNAWGLQSQWLARDWRKGLALVQESLLHPTFPADELARVQTQTLARIQEQQDDPMGAASLLLRKTFFGAHPYGRPSLGTSASVKNISRDDVQNVWNSVVLPRSIVLAVYGDVSAEDVRRAAEYSFKGFNREGSLPRAPAPTQVLTKFTEQVQASKPGVAQAVLFFGYPTIDVRNPDRYALDVLDAALSGANLPGGRLHARLRDNQLVYVVHAFDQPGVDPGMFVVYAATQRENVERVRGIIEEEMNRVRQEDISPEELARAKTMSISAHAIESQTNMAQASQAASDELFGLGYRSSAGYEARINAIALEDVRRVANHYLRPDAAALAIVEPPAPTATAPAAAAPAATAPTM